MTLRPPAEISKEIELLILELEQSQKFYSKVLLVDNDSRCSVNAEDIGVFRLSNAKKILSALYDLRILTYEHETLGTYKVNMNPQKNRILVVSKTDSDSQFTITESSIMHHIIWGYGKWYTT